MKRANLLHPARVSLSVARMESYFFNRLITRANLRYSVTDHNILNLGQVTERNKLFNVKLEFQ